MASSLAHNLNKEGQVEITVHVAVLGAETKLVLVFFVGAGLCPLASVLLDNLDVDLDSRKVDGEYVAKYKAG